MIGRVAVKRTVVSAMVISLLLPCIGLAREKMPTKEERAARQVKMNGQVNALLARELGLPLAAIEHARGRDYPFGHAIFFAVVAKMAKVKIKDVVDLSDKGLTWGQICEKFGLDPIEVMAEKKRIFKKVRDSVGIPSPTSKEWHKLLAVHPE